MKKKQAYLLGDMLNKGSQWVRAWERDKINELDNVEIFSPADQKDINDKSKKPTAEMIFAKDTGAILASEIIVAEIANTSVGSITEIGQIWGINYMIGRLKDIMENTESSTAIAYEVQKLLLEIPEKTVYWHTNDIRDTDIEESSFRRSHSYNQYLIGCLLNVSGEPMKFDEILDELKEGN